MSCHRLIDRFPGGRQAAAIILALSVFAGLSPAEAAPGRGKSRPRPARRTDGVTFAGGAVESAGVGYLVIRDTRYDIRRATVLFPGGKPAPPGSAGLGSRVSLTIRNGQVVEVVILDSAGLE